MRISDWSSDVCSSDLADAVLKRIARYASGWWPFLTKPEAIPGRLDFIRSQPDYNGRLDEVFYGFATTRVGEGHAVHDDPRARPGMTRQEIIDRLGWFAELGVTHSSVPIPALQRAGDYYDYKQWVRSEEHTSELQHIMRTPYSVFCL